MSNTLRIYYREYGTGIVGLVGGYQGTNYNTVKHWALMAAEAFAKEIGLDQSKIQEDRDGGLHVIKAEWFTAVGRHYFIADSPLQVPLGEGWIILSNEDGEETEDIVFGFVENGEAVKLTWRAMSQDEIDHQHGNDEFGGWTDPILTIGSNDPLWLDEREGEADAVMLMMRNTNSVTYYANKMRSGH